MRAILSAVMMWVTLAGGAGSAPGAAVGAAFRDGLISRHASYVSTWDGNRISAQAMRQLW